MKNFISSLIVCVSVLFLVSTAHAGGNPNVHKQLEKDWSKVAVNQFDVDSTRLYAKFVRNTKVSDNAFVLTTFDNGTNFNPLRCLYFKYQKVDHDSEITLEFDYLFPPVGTNVDTKIEVLQYSEIGKNKNPDYQTLLECKIRRNNSKYWKQEEIQNY